MSEQMLEGKKILFISGGFYNYDAIIKERIERMGGQVFYYCSAPTTNHTKMRIYQRMMFLRKKYCDSLYQQITVREYDYIFMLNSARLTDEFVEKLSKRYANIPKILYCWDSVRTIPEVEGRMKYFDRVLSFDPRDAQTLDNVGLLPLFYTDGIDDVAPIDTKYDFSFVGFGHSKRYSFIKRVKEYADNNGYKYNFNLYLPSMLYYIRGKYVNKTFKDAKKSDFIFQSLPSAKVNQIMSASKIVIDYEVGTQKGLTMRTIECLGMKKKLITTNSEVKHYDFYNPNNILIVDKEDTQLDIEQSFVQSPFEEIDERVYRKYSLDEWLKRIFFFEEYVHDKYYNANI